MNTLHKNKIFPTRTHGVGAERQREWTFISVHVANYLHDARVLDAADVAQDIGLVTIDALLDCDIPVRIQVHKENWGPAWISWGLWPDDRGRKTWGTMSICRLTATHAILEAGSYVRSRERSPRLGRIPVPDAKRGLNMAEFELHGIKTTF